jgi:hypothetical protein
MSPSRIAATSYPTAAIGIFVPSVTIGIAQVGITAIPGTVQAFAGQLIQVSQAKGTTTIGALGFTFVISMFGASVTTSVRGVGTGPSILGTLATAAIGSLAYQEFITIATNTSALAVGLGTATQNRSVTGVVTTASATGAALQSNITIPTANASAAVGVAVPQTLTFVTGSIATASAALVTTPRLQSIPAVLATAVASNLAWNEQLALPFALATTGVSSVYDSIKTNVTGVASSATAAVLNTFDYSSAISVSATMNVASVTQALSISIGGAAAVVSALAQSSTIVAILSPRVSVTTSVNTISETQNLTLSTAPVLSRASNLFISSQITFIKAPALITSVGSVTAIPAANGMAYPANATAVSRGLNHLAFCSMFGTQAVTQLGRVQIVIVNGASRQKMPLQMVGISRQVRVAYIRPDRKRIVYIT